MPDKEKDEKKRADNNELVQEISEEKKRETKKGFLSHFRSALKTKGISLFGRGVGGIIDEYKAYKDKKGELIEKYEAYETVVAGSTDTIEYYVLLLLSCLIATMGLYINSAAVIIGAMIVAPLMGPVFGFSAGILWGSGKTITEAVTTLLKGTLLVIIVTSLLSFFIPSIVVTPEILSRSKPSFFDIIIAISCGFIGAYAYVNKRVSSAIPGVAISVALLPPLCTAGIGIGLRQWDLAMGAGLLYAINLVGISTAALIVFYLVRLHPQSDDKKEFIKATRRALGSFFISLLFLLLISLPLVYFTATSLQTSLEKETIYNVINSFQPGDSIYSFEIIPGDPEEIRVVLLHQSKSAPNVRLIESKLARSLKKQVKLTVFMMNQAEQE
ncbi:MAG: TIGR00341 family protein [Spirochaetales bacterium]|nr:TIGR00341 family protein [Spirochaetales bacterium]